MISGETIAYLEPQETVWRGQSGRKFTLAKTIAQMKLDALAPFENVCGFQRDLLSYPATLFRFPLRTDSTEKLSSNTYTVEKLHVLLSALRKEAKFLLLFLRSVHTIEVFDIAAHGSQTLSFKVSIDEQAGVSQKRITFLRDLRSQHQRQQYGISKVISYTADFHVSIVDNNHIENQTGKSHWLVANQAGSTDRTVCQAAVQQCVFPWVGTALEVQDAVGTKSSSGGRIFCFIPMPGMASSGLPIHVNGTFGVNDDRRTLKWPDRERRNDPTANWNITLATKLLPPCYASLLFEAQAKLAANSFYAAWPTVSAIPEQWKGLLEPLFTSLFSQRVLWAKAVGEWIRPDEGVFIPSSAVLADVVQATLSKCGVKLVNLPSHIWAALAHIGKGVREVSPQLARQCFRNQSSAYSGTLTNEANKKTLLKYCLSDKQYHDLQGIVLLPMANGSFVAFQNRGYYSSTVYLCSSDCPQYLLPNMNASLVDVTGDSELHRSLGEVADQSQTQLYKLTVENVAVLLSQAMPKEWQQCQVVSMPHARFPKTWFQTFWQWANNLSTLKPFQNSLTVPVLQTGHANAASQFRVARLTNTQAILLVPSYTYLDPSLLSALDKLQVMCCTQDDFPYVRHRQAIACFKSFDPNGVLIAIATTCPNASAIARLTFQAIEAECLCEFLSKTPYSSDGKKKAVLSNLAIYSTTSGTLCSVSNAQSSSVVRKAILEPQNSAIGLQHLPSSLILFSNRSQSQTVLLQRCGGVEVLSDVELLLTHIFPLIMSGQISSDDLMADVLTMFQALKPRDYDNRLISALQDLPFLNGWQRKRPRELFDPLNEVSKLFQGEARFPIAPFDSRSHLQVLRLCGLRTSVTAQELVNIIVEIGTAGQQRISTSAVKIARTKAVLKYIENNVLNQLDSHCSITVQGSCQVYSSFSQALKYLAQYFSWLPIAQRPQDYPTCLQWKGAGYESCFTSLDSATLALAANNQNKLPYIVGSQVFVIDPPLHSKVVNAFPSNSYLASHIVEHFKQVLHHQGEIHPAMLERMVIFTYQVLSKASAVDLSSLPPWVWIKRDNKFVRPSEVALKQDSNFRHNLEPYIYTLPDNLLLHSELFERFGAKDIVSRDQIVSVLEKIANSASHQVTDWDTVMSILNWLTKDGTQECDLDSIFVPVDSGDETLKLIHGDKLVYTDNEYLKEYTESAEFDTSYTFVHERINPNLAHCLGIQPLDKFLDITEDTFEDSGQSEPLTTRLKNILRDYKDGLTIIKELLQNADDAGATEVNICHDARTHTVPVKSLFFRGMSECHGPALIVHNNSVFEDEDFRNIEKLAGATKENKTLKIGKFGVGFCSVYHITDVPSFISRDKLVIFDPTISFLTKEIKNPAQPGKRITFSSKLIAKSSQLEPYKNLFGFNPQQPYNGTMFRLPFRTQHSELSSTIYSSATVKELTDSINASSSKLLLFLQKVKRITFQQIDPGCKEPRLILDIRKELVPFPLQLSNTVIQKLTCAVNDSPLTSEYFLVAANTQTIDGKLATASVACEVQEVQPGSTVLKMGSTTGETFCFLPLSQKTGLPVHVSANFAVINNRRGIWTSDETTPTSVYNPEVIWNESLMLHVIPTVYHQLLTSLQQMCANGKMQDYSSSFHSLWPTTSGLQQRNPWEHVVASLYHLISTGRLFYSHSTGQWLTLKESKFLKPGILCHGEVVLPCVQNTVNQLRMPTIDLPAEYRAHLSISSQTITEEAFLEMFFESLSSSVFNQGDRNEVICHILETYAAEYDDGTHRCYSLEYYLKTYACIPCSPDGSVLKLPTDVVATDAKFSKLYNPKEHMFPVQELVDRHLVYGALQTLGMIWNFIPWKMVIERVNTVTDVFQIDKVKALQRTSLILDCIEKYTDQSKLPTEKQKMQLIAVNFLPVLQTPSRYNLPWFGENCQLLSAKQLMKKSGRSGRFDVSRDNACLAGSQVAFVCEASPEDGGCGYIHDKTREMLTIRLAPSPVEVICHFRKVVVFFQQSEITESLITRTEAICRQVYAFLDSQLGSDEKAATPGWVKELRSIPCLWSENKFTEVTLIAENWKTNGPYLFPMPRFLMTNRKLSSALHIKKSFTLKDFQQTLQKMKEEFGSKSIDDACQVLFREIQSGLQAIFSKKNEDSEQTEPVCIALPDQAFVLHWSTDLAYNDAAWLPQEGKYMYVHDQISRILAKQLGVKAVRSELLREYETEDAFIGSEFGQREELTRRIQNIIRDYPFDITVLKELLQNADDAKATKMCVILDKRMHTKKGILSEEWEKLQGPALLVWNDSTFSEDDLRGIQNLGLGSKRSDAETIGQYGIGFNVVYHLTDCPSFVTGGETMCILDPHCRYVGGAKRMHPGRRLNNVKGFWKDFAGMQSPYLRAGLDNCPEEMLGGSLFRFPLRHTLQLVMESMVIDHDKLPEATKVDSSKLMELASKAKRAMSTKVLDSFTMHHKLMEWAPKIKQAMFFLNHVKELRFYVIEKDSNTMITEHHFQTEMDTSAHLSCNHLRTKISAFKQEKGSESGVFRYQLTLTELSHKQDSSTVKKEEQWVVQQGVGDIRNTDRSWMYVDQVKPRHGLATPFHHRKEPYDFSGQVFCFLPLPIRSTLPVHINGHFILNSTRRELWQSSDPEVEDDRSRWNKYLFEAITSSYEDLLINGQSFFITQEYESVQKAKDAIRHYYKLFPDLSHTEIPDASSEIAADRDRGGSRTSVQPSSSVAPSVHSGHPSYPSKKPLEGPWLEIARSVYIKLHDHNAKVLAVIGKSFSVEVHPLKNEDNPSKQVYFWSAGLRHFENNAVVKPILENIGMLITEAPWVVCANFKIIGEILPSTKPTTVFRYYTSFSDQASPSGLPCAIEETKFATAGTFEKFTKFLLKPSDSSKEVLVYPESPFSHPLLMTADGQLRCFDEASKVIRSTYYQIFPASLDKFLHPSLLGIQYIDNYFVECDAANDVHQALVENILTDNMPWELRTRRVEGADLFRYIQQLTELWKCLADDKIFNAHLAYILQGWALLLSTDGRLFSLSSEILPVCKPASLDQPAIDAVSFDIRSVYNLLVKLKMPFLNAEVVTAQVDCPTLYNYTRVLAILYHMHCEAPMALSKAEVSTLVSYLKNVNFSSNHTALVHVTSLPLFENIDGSFTPISNKAPYMWNNDACSTGYPKWLRQPGVVFLKPSGAWKSLDSLEVLGLKDVHAEDIYVDFIFPGFSEMNCDERYKHLKFIKNSYSLFELNIFRKTSKAQHSRQIAEKARAEKFLGALANLPCIGKDGEVLKRARDFATHEKEIFTTFTHHYRFLPPFSTESKHERSEWLKFFIGIGLRTSITQEEFLQFCEETSKGDHENPRKASSVLLDYLFSEQADKDRWKTDKRFLVQVSSIPFVCTCPLASLSWIKPVAAPPKTIQHGTNTICMTQLSGAAVDKQTLQWTIRPVISLPRYIGHYMCENDAALLAHVKVVRVLRREDVLNNIRNICSGSRFANFTLFHNYPKEFETPEYATSLLDVMVDNFRFLSASKNLTNTELTALGNLSCIPVFNTVKPPQTQMVLVKPCHVLTSDASEYHPFLITLPYQLQSVLQLLSLLGVHNTVELNNVQVALQTCFEQSEEACLEPDFVVAIVIQLYKLLDKSRESRKPALRDEELAKLLTPLYLPSTENKLVPTTSLMYCDSSMHRSLRLADTGKSILNLPFRKYHFFERQLCLYLPKDIRPKTIHQCTDWKLSSECREVEHSKFSKRLETTLHLSVFPRAVMAVVKHRCRNACSPAFEKLLLRTLQNIHVATIQGLKFEVTLKGTEQSIGIVSQHFYLQSDNQSGVRKLYLNSSIKPVQETRVCQLLMDVLVSTVRSEIDPLLYCEMEKIMQTLFQAATPEEIQSVLWEEEIMLEPGDGDFNPSTAYELGKPIPEYLCHRLQQDPDNVFHPMEWVGYEDEDTETIVFARIMHLVPSATEVHAFQRKYRIYISENDEDGIEVSVLDIYKFQRGPPKLRSIAQEASGTDMVAYEGESDANKVRSEWDSDTIRSIKRKLCRDLKVIWTLPEDEKTKAIRRLYMKWHPDKNLDDPDKAEVIFKFLLAQIERLSNGLDVDEDDDTTGSRRSNRSREWEHNFHTWEQRAHQHARSYQNESTFWRTGGGGGGGGRGGGGGGWGPDLNAGSPFDDPVPTQKPDIGNLWFRQAEADYRCLLNALAEATNSDATLSGHVCFLAHQVAEKALKGGMFAECGDANLMNHNLTPLAYALQQKQPGSTQGLATHAVPLESYYLDPRYPNRWSPPAIPADKYALQDAQMAQEHAGAILETVRGLPNMP